MFGKETNIQKSVLKRKFAPRTVWEYGLVVTFFITFFVFVDLFNAKSSWNYLQTDNPLMIWCTAGACAVALDVPPAIAGYVLKKYLQGLTSKRECIFIVTLAFAAFSLAFFFNFGLKILMDDLLFSVNSASGLVNTATGAATETTEEHPAVLVAAIYSGIVPLLTSISSFLISFIGCDPLKAERMRYEQMKLELEDEILEYEVALCEVSSVEQFVQERIAREKDMHIIYKQKLRALSYHMMETFVVLLMEKYGDTEDVVNIMKASENMKEKYFGSETEKADNLEKYLENYLNAQQNVAADSYIS